MERKVTVVGIQHFTPKDPARQPMHKIHYTYDDDKVSGLGCDNVLVSDSFMKRYNPEVGVDYLAGVYFDNDYRTHFACLFSEA